MVFHLLWRSSRCCVSAALLLCDSCHTQVDIHWTFKSGYSKLNTLSNKSGIRMYLSNWFYPHPQIEPTKWEKDYWNTIIPTVLFCVLLSNGYFFKVMLPTEARLWASEILAYTSVVATFLRRSEEYDRRQGKPSLTTGWHRRGGVYPRPPFAG